MRNFLFAAFLVIVSHFVALAQTVQVKGSIKNIPQGESLKVKLESYYGSKLELSNFTSTDQNGSFTLTLEKPERGFYELSIVGYNNETLVLGNEPVVYVRGDYNTIRENGIHAAESNENEAKRVLDGYYTVFAAKIDSLSFLSNQLDSFDPFKETRTKELEQARDEAIETFNSSLKSVQKQFPGTYVADILVPLYHVPNYRDFEQYKDKYDNDISFRHLHYFDYIDFSNPTIVNNPVLEGRYFQYLNDYSSHHIDGFKFAVDHMMQTASPNEKVKVFTFEYLVNIFSENGPAEIIEHLNNSSYLDECSSPVSEDTKVLLNAMEQLKPGSDAPELLINNFNYQPISMHNLPGKAKFIYFWASWCPHCMEETPGIYELYQQYKDKGLAVYAVSLDSEYSAWVKAIQDMGLSWQNVSELKEWESESAKIYAVSKTPTIILLDENNKIVKRDISPGELKRRLAEMLH